MTTRFCYDHKRMAYELGKDSYNRPIFYCEPGKHFVDEHCQHLAFANPEALKEKFVQNLLRKKIEENLREEAWQKKYTPI